MRKRPWMMTGLPALVLMLGAAWPSGTVATIQGASCGTHHRVVVCVSATHTATTTVLLTPRGAVWSAHHEIPFSYFGAPGSLRLASSLAQNGRVTLNTSVSRPTELVIGSTAHPAAVLYLDVPKLPPWPTEPRDTTPPKTNVAPPSTFATTPSTAYWAALKRANRKEGKPALVLPRNFSSLSPADQLFVLANLERIVHGLWPLYGVSPALNRAAVAGVQRGTDPALPASTKMAWGSNWYSGTGAIQATFSWMYDDGYGSQNIDCQHPGAMGCWGHRDNILGAWGPYGLFGGAVLHPLLGRSGTAEVFKMGLSPTATGPLTYTWQQAVRAGARPTGLS